MKVLICLLVALFALIQVNATNVKVIGEIENHTFIDRVLTYAAADKNDYVSKAFTFPPKPIFSTYKITGYKQTDEGDAPEVKIVGGGVGSKFVTMVVTTAELGKPLATTFEFYGDKLNN